MIPLINQAPRFVTCYHCGEGIESTASARSTSCPHCHKRLVHDDMIIEVAPMWSGPIETCGRVVIGPSARLSTRHVSASESVDVEGDLTARVTCRGLVCLGGNSIFKGDCTAATLEVERGAIIKGGFFQIGPQS